MSQKLTQQELLYQVETFLADNYQFRNNILSGKIEVRCINKQSDGNSSLDNESDEEWKVLTEKAQNTIVLKAKAEGIGDTSSPRKMIEEVINSESTPEYNPIVEYLDRLPEWDGKNHVAEFFSRIPGINSEQLAWCATWMRSAVAHWKGIDKLHGNENAPILIGDQGCGKSTFANRLLPAHMRKFYLSRINFGNKFDRDMALTNNLFVNIDEFDRLRATQQAHLKQALSEFKVNGRKPYGKVQEDRLRFASFIGTTNDIQPLTDPTGSRRFICLRIPKGMFIDNKTDINYKQLYAQLVKEVNDGVPYWFEPDQVARIQQANAQFFKSEDLEEMLKHCYRLPEKDEAAEWLDGASVYNCLKEQYPTLNTRKVNSIKIKIGQTLKNMGCDTKHSMHGIQYHLIPIAA